VRNKGVELNCGFSCFVSLPIVLSPLLLSLGGFSSFDDVACENGLEKGFRCVGMSQRMSYFSGAGRGKLIKLSISDFSFNGTDTWTYRCPCK